MRVLMAEERPYSATRYKYCRTEGGKRVGSEHPNPPPCESAGVENDDLHCIHAQNIWFVVSWSSGGGGGRGGPLNYKKQNNASGKFLCITLFTIRKSSAIKWQK